MLHKGMKSAPPHPPHPPPLNLLEVSALENESVAGGGGGGGGNTPTQDEASNMTPSTPGTAMNFLSSLIPDQTQAAPPVSLHDYPVGGGAAAVNAPSVNQRGVCSNHFCSATSTAAAHAEPATRRGCWRHSAGTTKFADDAR